MGENFEPVKLMRVYYKSHFHEKVAVNMSC